MINSIFEIPVQPGGGGGGGTPGGSDTQVQFNDATAFGGDSKLTFNKTTGKLTATLLDVGTNAISLNGAGKSLTLYNAYTSPTNYESLLLRWTSNQAQLLTDQGGAGGTGRVLRIGGYGTVQLWDTSNADYLFTANSDGIQTYYELGRSTAAHPVAGFRLSAGLGDYTTYPGLLFAVGNANALTGNQTAFRFGSAYACTTQFNPASGDANFIFLDISPTINQTAGCTGSYRALQIAPYEQSALGTSNRLLSLGAKDGSAVYTEKAYFDNTGSLAFLPGASMTIYNLAGTNAEFLKFYTDSTSFRIECNKLAGGTVRPVYVGADSFSFYTSAFNQTLLSLAPDSVSVYGGGQRIMFSPTHIIPAADNTIDLGGAGNAFKDLYLTGKLTINGLMGYPSSGSVNDDASITLPAITNAARGSLQVGNNEEYAEFLIDNDGDVTLLLNSAGVVAGADTDGKVCIGTAATQEPLLIKNRLGAAKNFNLILYYN